MILGKGKKSNKEGVSRKFVKTVLENTYVSRGYVANVSWLREIERALNAPHLLNLEMHNGRELVQHLSRSENVADCMLSLSSMFMTCNIFEW